MVMDTFQIMVMDTFLIIMDMYLIITNMYLIIMNMNLIIMNMYLIIMNTDIIITSLALLRPRLLRSTATNIRVSLKRSTLKVNFHEKLQRKSPD